MFKNLRNRLLNLILLSVFTITLLAFTAIFLVVNQNAQSVNRAKLQRVAASPIGFVMEYRNNRRIEQAGRMAEMMGSLAADFSSSFVLLVDDEARLTTAFSYVDISDEDIVLAANHALADPGDYSVMKIGSEYWMYLIGEAKAMNMAGVTDEATKQIAFINVSDSRASMSVLLITLLAALLLTLLAMFFVGLSFANRAIKPVQESFAKQKRFITDASHELKTPLSVIKANMEIVNAHPDETIASQSKWLERVDIETARMNDLIKHMLLLAQNEERDLHIKKEAFSVSELAEKALLAVEAMIFEQRVTLRSRIAPLLEISSDKEMVQQLMYILLENAFKYTPEGGNIVVQLFKAGHQIHFTVTNTGAEAIGEGDLPALFDRFYRADQARSREGDSFGLGLSIARATAQQLGGEVQARKEDPERITFAFNLPIK